VASTQEDLFQAIQRSKSRVPTKKKRRPHPLLWVGVVATCVVVSSIAFWALTPSSPEDRARNALQALAKADKAKSTPPPPVMLKVSSVSFKNSFFEKSPSEAVLAWNFQFTLTNNGNAVETEYDLHARSIRLGRPSHDYITTDFAIPIRGGIRPKESITENLSIECAKLTGSEALGRNLPDDLTLQVSVDGKTWVSAHPN
jgi:hypothetical protein